MSKRIRRVIKICVFLNTLIILTTVLVLKDNHNIKSESDNSGQASDASGEHFKGNFPPGKLDAYHKLPKEVEPNRTDEKFATLIHLPINFNFSHKDTKLKHQILWYNLPSWKNIQNQNKALKTCEINNCFVTDNKSAIESANAIIFVPSVTGMDSSPPVSRGDRDHKQVWIFYSLEPPMNFRHQGYKSPRWLNTMNWSMTYRLDADIFAPYGTFRYRQTPPKRDYRRIFLQKTKMAAWVVSHCGAESQRDEYVQELVKNGVNVDIFGKCGKNGFIKDLNMDKVLNEYNFFIAFENSFCKEYISCKVFRKYNLHTLLIVRGGANYTKLMPQGTYINTDDFASVKLLAEYLVKLSKDQVQYIRMLRRKDKFEALDEDNFGETFAMCELCRKLNNVEKYRRTYISIQDYIEDRQCWLPKDLPRNITKTYNRKRSRIYLE